MLDWLFGKKEGMEEVKEETKKGFNSVKEDLNKTHAWIKHLGKQDDELKTELFLLKEELASIKDELEGVKNAVSFHDLEVYKKIGQSQTARLNKQTAVYAVQEGVQTAVQTGSFNSFLDMSKLSVMERAIIMVLLNTDMKLSYDDLSAMLGKDRSTIRGHINRIKQKSEIIEETIEQNGKKRVFIPSEYKEKMLKNAKVRVKKGE